MSAYLAPADSRLTGAVATEGWLDDFEANQAMGYGDGEKGAQKAYESLVGAFQRGSLYGVYRDEEPIGLVILDRDPSLELAQFHGLVAPRYRRTVWAARVVDAITEGVFENGTYRLETEVLVRNKPAVRLLKGRGFTQEGYHPARHKMDGKRYTTVTLRMLKKDWRK